MGEGWHIICNASLSQPNVQKNSRAHVRGGGGLKSEKKKCLKKRSSPHLRKKVWHRFPCILYFFIHPQPNNIGPTRALFLISLSLFGGGLGAQLLHISFVTTGLHGICNGSKNGMEDRVTHSSPTALGLGISAPHTRTQISEFGLGLECGHKSVLSSATRLQEI